MCAIMDRYIDRYIDKQKDRQAGRQAGRERERERERESERERQTDKKPLQAGKEKHLESSNLLRECPHASLRVSKLSIQPLGYCTGGGV